MSGSIQKICLSVDNLRPLIPKLTHVLHKGQCGRIAVIGGSKEYTGAPYFAAMAALRLGADLVHIFCPENAGTAIKCYSPDVIVHPVLDNDDAITQITNWLPRFHSVVIGPGLGREPKTVDLCLKLITVLKEMNKITVIDADALYAVTSNPCHLKGFKSAILTPNFVEYKRLYDAVVRSSAETSPNLDLLPQKLPDVTIVCKGAEDKIYINNKTCIMNQWEGIPRRCGGQGDILSGAIAQYAFYVSLQQHRDEECPDNMLAAYGGCFFTKLLSMETYKEKGRAVVTNDLVEHIPKLMKDYEKYLW